MNDTSELHLFHIHQVHFLAYKTNGKAEAQPEWLDTVNVPAKGSVDLIMDFTDPIIRGTSLFHCHLLKHEDQGMMAKILFSYTPSVPEITDTLRNVYDTCDVILVDGTFWSDAELNRTHSGTLHRPCPHEW